MIQVRQYHLCILVPAEIILSICNYLQLQSRFHERSQIIILRNSIFVKSISNVLFFLWL